MSATPIATPAEVRPPRTAGASGSARRAPARSRLNQTTVDRSSHFCCTSGTVSCASAIRSPRVAGGSLPLPGWGAVLAAPRPVVARRVVGRSGPARLTGMEPSRDAILEALEQVIDPELRRPVTDLDMVREIGIDGGDVTVTIALTVAGCPLRASFEDQVAQHVGAVAGVTGTAVAFEVMSPEEKAALSTKLRGGVAERTKGICDRPLHACPRDRERQRRSRQVVAHGQPGRRALEPGPPRRRPRRRHLRPFGPAPARCLAASGRRRPDDRAAGRAGREADVDRLLPRRQRSRHVARPDAPPRARAVPLGRALGRARRPARRHASRHRGRVDLARPAPSPRRGGDRDDSAAARAGSRRARRADGAEDGHARDRRGREHDLRGLRRGRRGRLARAAGVPLLGTVPLDARLRESGDRGEPLVWADPDADAARAIVAVAEAIEAAKRTFKPLPVLS